MKASRSVVELLTKYKITPKNLELYEQAITHSSYAHEMGLTSLDDYDRLEFMGDSVLQIVSADYLYKKYPNKAEGELTVLRSKLVRGKSLSKLGRELGIVDMINLSNGEEKNRGKSDNIIEDVVEAIIGAIYIDQGFNTAFRVARDFVNKLLKEVKDDSSIDNYKNTLQEFIQSDSREPLKYTLIKSTGLDNDKTFYVQVSHDGVILGKGKGKSKKAAEQEAAKEALKKLVK